MESPKRKLDPTDGDAEPKRPRHEGDDAEYSSSDDESRHPDSEEEEDDAAPRLIKTRSKGPASPPPVADINEVMDNADEVVNDESDFSDSTEEDSEEEESSEEDDEDEDDESDTEEDGYSDDDSFVTSSDEGESEVI